ncbi:glycosyltransferase [Seonamhaeicola aphaedonensis]|uniref:Glycosyltransferase involved in cell wall biosynthesis n=1 Tax=Seonamhaeicola aphaedonensis TaxID=1461338 RepID=A0A3D9HG49_9FLAO|nr:glycosyltransferase [Seonamhaeicola aphaedonensis]RED48453.1 glycosyltransferase involved in cell wall biosynthesis [Seonamhaeicola aphaedonensis]
MKILLLGEYSNFHNSLKKGIESLGHKVVIAGRNDGFKSYPVDISFDPVVTVKKPLRYIRGIIYRVCKFDISIYEIVFLFLKNKKKLKNFDVVQFINEYPIKSTPFFDRFLLKSIFKHNNKVFISACGDDVIYLNYLLNTSLPHHILTPYIKNPKLKKHFKFSLNYLSKSHKKLHDYVVKHSNGFIPADMDYEMAYKDLSIAKPLIPFPINTDAIKYNPLKVKDKIHIFHGINRVNFYKKGNDYFCEALKHIQNKYKDRVIITEVTSIPYKEYIKLYNKCHILLDQVYAYDQGYNALEAMAQGKVVFTGISKQFTEYYNINKTIGIHTIPNVDKIVNDLIYLIENPKKIEEISKNSRAYILEYHDYKKVAQQYIDCWLS